MLPSWPTSSVLNSREVIYQFSHSLLYLKKSSKSSKGGLENWKIFNITSWGSYLKWFVSPDVHKHVIIASFNTFSILNRAPKIKTINPKQSMGVLGIHASVKKKKNVRFKQKRSNHLIYWQKVMSCEKIKYFVTKKGVY